MIRCIKVEILKDLYLPRFRALKGFLWSVRPDRLEKEGFTLGGGFVQNNEFKVIGITRSRGNNEKNTIQTTSRKAN